MGMFDWATEEKTCYICGDPFDSPASSRLGKHQMNLHYAGGNGKTRAHCYDCVVRAVQVFKAIEEVMKPYREHDKNLHEHEVEMLRGAMKAQDERERKAGELCGVSWEENGCDWPDAVAETVIVLRKKLADAESRAK